MGSRLPWSRDRQGANDARCGARRSAFLGASPCCSAQRSASSRGRLPARQLRREAHEHEVRAACRNTPKTRPAATLPRWCSTAISSARCRRVTFGRSPLDRIHPLLYRTGPAAIRSPQFPRPRAPSHPKRTGRRASTSNRKLDHGTHIPPAQFGVPPGHTSPQDPQLDGSLLTSTSQPSTFMPLQLR